jgi:hypothetical protein
MSILREATEVLHAIEAELRDPPEGGLDSTRLAERIHHVVALLSDDEARWIGTTEAKRLLGVNSENTVKAWARLGLLHSRTLPNGRTQILVDDVLNERQARADLTAVDRGPEVSPGELMHLLRPRLYPREWQPDAGEVESAR